MFPKKKNNLLFRIRQKMRDHMTQSGTHDSDPWNFVDVAMNKIPGGRRLPKVGILYFFRQCEEFPNIDTAFHTFLDNNLKGSTVSGVVELEDDSTEFAADNRCNKGSNKKARLEKDHADTLASIRVMSEQTSRIYAKFQRTNIVMEKIRMIQVELEVAKMLGDTDRIKELAMEMKELNRIN